VPVVLVFESPSFTREQYEESVRRLTDGGTVASPADWPSEGLLAHIAGPTDEGFRVIDVWESEEAFASFGQFLMPVLQELGVGGGPDIKPVHTLVT